MTKTNENGTGGDPRAGRGGSDGAARTPRRREARAHGIARPSGLRIADDPRARPARGNLKIAVDTDEPEVRPIDRNLRIAVDFDGVLFDHVPYVLRGFRDAHGIDLEAEGLRYWDFFQYRAVREKNLTWRCVHTILSAIERDPVLHADPPRDPHAKSVLARWRDAGHRVHVVTARPEESRSMTAAFLRKNDVPHDELVMGASIKTGYDVLVDDAPHNVLMAAADGSFAVLMDHSYNRDVPTRRNPVRARSWLEVERLVTLAQPLPPQPQEPVLA